MSRKRKINFLYSSGGYQKVLDDMINPIIKYLPEDSYIKHNGELEDCLNVGFFMTPKKYNRIFMSHGIADKNWRNGDSVKQYDYICVSGSKWKDKMIKEGISEDKILITGYTKLDPLFNDFKKEKNKTNKIRVLYAPTHNTNKNRDANTVSCYPRLEKYFFKIPDDIELISSIHPYHAEKHLTTFDLFKWSDVVISDCSSVLYEAWSLGIPVVFPDWLVKKPILDFYKNSFEDQIYTQQIGYHANNIEYMWDLIREAKYNGLSLDKTTVDFIEGIFPTYLRGNSGKVTADILLKLALD